MVPMSGEYSSCKTYPFFLFLYISFISREYYEKYKVERERKQREEEEVEKKKQEEIQKQATVNEEQMFDPLSYLCE